MNNTIRIEPSTLSPAHRHAAATSRLMNAGEKGSVRDSLIVWTVLHIPVVIIDSQASVWSDSGVEMPGRYSIVTASFWSDSIDQNIEDAVAAYLATVSFEVTR